MIQRRSLVSCDEPIRLCDERKMVAATQPGRCHEGGNYEPIDNNFALPPVATVFTVSVRSVAKRNR